MIIIGEKINGTRKAVGRAIRERDTDFIRQLAQSQTKAGSNYLDINAGTPQEREPQDMVWLVEQVQAAVDIPLCLDSANPVALQAGLQVVEKRPLINSISGETARITGILPLALEFQTDVILLALDELTGIPATSQGRMEIVHKLMTMATKGGLAQNQLYIDPLVTTISTSTENAKITFDTIRQIKATYPDAHIICGLSNISFGMPLRALINRTFLAMCMAVGLDGAIVDPNDRKLREVLMAADMLMGNDYYCLNFTKAFRAGHIGTPV